MNDIKRTVRRTKIVATLGPATETGAMVSRLLEAGVNVFRMNFSHGTHRWHEKLIKTIRCRAEALSAPVAVMQDLQGPRLRTGRLKDGQAVELKKNEPVTITPGDFEGTARCIPTGYRHMPDDVRAGGRILLSDGLIELKVSRISGREVHCRVAAGGLLRENQGINLPGAELRSAPPTEKDIEDLTLGIGCGVDYVAMSFVSRAEELNRLRREIDKLAPDDPPAIVAKIERPQAVENLREILSASDAVMVARGDLGIEMNPEEVPPIQKHIIKSANECAKPVITATQMLDSMIGSPRPTRAETSDVANAILDGADAVMLSGETAVGRYPAETVDIMGRIAARAEPLLPPTAVEIKSAGSSASRAAETDHTRALARAACRIAEDAGAKAIAVFTMTGATARFIAQRRMSTPIFALSPVESARRRLALVWGVTPIPFPLLDNTDDMISIGKEKLASEGVAGPGDTVVCIAGHSTRTAGGSDMIQLLTF